MAKYVLIRPALFAVAFMNGAVRELTYGKNLGEYERHTVGTAAGIVLLGIAIYAVNIIWPFQGRAQAFYVGLIWTALTIIAESVMLLVFMKRDIKFLLAAYDIRKGQLWPIVLVFLLLFPVIIAGGTR